MTTADVEYDIILKMQFSKIIIIFCMGLLLGLNMNRQFILANSSYSKLFYSWHCSNSFYLLLSPELHVYYFLLMFAICMGFFCNII